jgi:hypothetical protein
VITPDLLGRKQHGLEPRRTMQAVSGRNHLLESLHHSCVSRGDEGIRTLIGLLAKQVPYLSSHVPMLRVCSTGTSGHSMGFRFPGWAIERIVLADLGILG